MKSYNSYITHSATSLISNYQVFVASYVAIFITHSPIVIAYSLLPIYVASCLNYFDHTLTNYYTL